MTIAEGIPSPRRVRALLPLLLALSAVGLGCMLPVHVTALAVESVEEWPNPNVAYDKDPAGPRTRRRSVERGPWVVMSLSSDSDLVSFSRRLGLHHLYVEGFQCPESAPNSYGFWGDYVFDASEEERKRLQVPDGTHLYRIFLPTDLDASIKSSGALHSDTEVEQVRNDILRRGLCVRLGAGSMIGLGIRSNLIRLAVTNEGGHLATSLVLVAVDGGAR